MKLLLVTATLCLASLVIQGCSTGSDDVIPWKESMVRGYRFQSSSNFFSRADTEITYMSFAGVGNSVAVTIRKGSAYVAPLWYWSIDESGRLVLSDYSKESKVVLELMNQSTNRMKVRMGESVLNYKRL